MLIYMKHLKNYLLTLCNIGSCRAPYYLEKLIFVTCTIRILNDYVILSMGSSFSQHPGDGQILSDFPLAIMAVILTEDIYC